MTIIQSQDGNIEEIKRLFARAAKKQAILGHATFARKRKPGLNIAALCGRTGFTMIDALYVLIAADPHVRRRHAKLVAAAEMRLASNLAAPSQLDP